MTEIKYIKSRAEWNATIDRNKFVLANFTASWCGPCKAIKPFIDTLYKKKDYKKIEFVRIDVDDCKDIASEFSITSIPTIVILELKKEVDRINSGIPQLLPQKLDELAKKANSDTSSGVRGSQVSLSKDIEQLVPNGFEILNDSINNDETVTLNLMPLLRNNSDVKSIFRTEPAVKPTAYTDADSQAMLFVQFNNISKVHSILIHLTKPEASDCTVLDEDELETECQPPSLVKVWANKPSILSFDEASSDNSAQNITKVEVAEIPGWFEIKLKYVRFQSVQTLNIFIDGVDEDSHTIIDSIYFVGIRGDATKNQPINSEE